MIDLYFATSPNVYKVCILLEELELDYRLIPIDLRTGAQFDAALIGGGETTKIPVLIDHDSGLAPKPIVESGAILQYLAEKSGRFLPQDPGSRSEAFQWLFWQMAGLGPFSGQCFHFRAIAPAIAPEAENSYARGRYEKILAAHWKVMERRLTERSFMADEYSIADIACYPWIRYLCPEAGRDAFPMINAWLETITARPAIKRAYDRARAVDMGAPRNEIDTTIYAPESLRGVIVY